MAQELRGEIPSIHQSTHENGIRQNWNPVRDSLCSNSEMFSFQLVSEELAQTAMAKRSHIFVHVIRSHSSEFLRLV